LNELRNATYRGLEGVDTLTLSDGRWMGPPTTPGGASRPMVTLVRNFNLRGDLDGDGSEEAVVLLGESSGGSGEFLHLAVVARRGGVVENVATALIGDRTQVRAAQVDSNQIILAVVQAGPQDAACCPGELATRIWTYSGGTLNPTPEETTTGRLALSVLQGHEWVLRWWDWDEPAPDSIEVTLSFQDGRLGGRSGCNRYSAPAHDGEMPGDLVLGPAVSTRMACPGMAMEVESRYLDNLRNAKKFGFMATLLSISYESEGAYRVMLFEGRVPAVAEN
jgi:heat shock protein HslJ